MTSSVITYAHSTHTVLEQVVSLLERVLYFFIKTGNFVSKNCHKIGGMVKVAMSAREKVELTDRLWASTAEFMGQCHA